MDTNETYIKMCDCPEIQGLATWDTETGDVEVDPKNLEGSARVYCVACENEYGGEYLNHIWLPTQSQLQKMLGCFPDVWESLWNEFEKYENGDNFYSIPDWASVRIELSKGKQRYRGKKYEIEHKFTSMEQLWAAFMMFELHQKTWDGEKWCR